MNDIKEEQKEFTRGLEGVVAAESNISYVDGCMGGCSTRATTSMTWQNMPRSRKRSICCGAGVCHTRAGCVPVRVGGRDAAPQPGARDAQADAAHSHPMAVLRTAVSMLANFDPTSKKLV